MSQVPATDDRLSPPYMPPRVVRAAFRLLKQAPSLLRGLSRKRALRAAYIKGRNGSAESACEEPDPSIVDEGATLRQRVLADNENRYRSSSYRVLMLRPPSITAELWFGGLYACMRHAGIDCRLLGPGAGAADVNACFEEFRPNVFIAAELPATLRSLDLEFIRDYKRRHDCLRLFVPTSHAGAPDRYSTPRYDQWRWTLRRNGLTADAYFSIFEREFYERYIRDRAGPDIDYVTVPQACNPFTDRPLAERKLHDYFMATSLTHERLAVTYEFVRPIMSRYRGLWAGPRWGFGRSWIPPSEMAACYAQTRIALSTLAGFVRHHAAELTHRVYAAAGCGAFQLTMPTAFTSRYFDADELVQAETAAEYERLFDHYVSRPAERNAIALRALRRAYRDHTCFNRIEVLVAHWDRWRRSGLF